MNRSRTGGSASIELCQTAVVDVMDDRDRRSHRSCLDDPAERSQSSRLDLVVFSILP